MNSSIKDKTIKFNLIAPSLEHISENEWNELFKKYNINLEIKYGYPDNKNDLLVLVDYAMFNYNTEFKNVIGWIVESPAILEYFNTGFFDRLNKIESQFLFIYTHDKKLVESSFKYKFFPYNDAWIKDNQIVEKSKLTSYILSHKKWTDGHLLRHKILENLPINMDVFDNITDKRIGLNDYYYSLTIENCKKDYYYSEKIIDCFKTKTIPIYWGCPSIGNFFDINGIITFDTIEELNSILKNISIEQYNLKLKSVEKNYQLVYNMHTFFQYFINYDKL